MNCDWSHLAIWSVPTSARKTTQVQLMIRSSSTHEGVRHAVRLWLLAVAALVLTMVVVGGATRLTRSGLSIVEWQPVTGAVPPLSHAAWLVEFEKYKAIPQYKELNSGMSLDEFKVIYWWEWSHRLLGRLIGVAFLLPLLWFLWKGWVGPGLRARLWTVFGLGALQGIAGWWMVASGLADRLSVSQYRLAFHLTLACVIYAMILWTAQSLRPRAAAAMPGRLRASAAGLLVLTLGQIYLGALVAGLHAGLIYNTWPLIDGNFLPAASHLFFNAPLWRNIFENPLTVQFDHRMLAYALWFFACAHVVDVAHSARAGAVLRSAFAFAAAVTVQAALGVLTLVYQAPLALALLHQAIALVVLTLAVIHAQRLATRGAHTTLASPVLLSP